MTRPEKQNFLVFCGIILCVVSKLVYNVCITKVTVLAHYISKYVSTYLASALMFMFLIIFFCSFLGIVLYLCYLFQDVFRGHKRIIKIQKKGGA